LLEWAAGNFGPAIDMYLGEFFVRRTTVISVLIPSALSLALAGCGSSASSGSPAGAATQGSSAASASPTTASNAHLTSAQVNDGTAAAAKEVTALHLKGTMDEGGQILTLDIQDNQDSGGGTFGESGISIPIRLVNGVSYLQMTPEVIQGLIKPKLTSGTDQAAAQLLANKWVSSNSASGKEMTQSLSGLLDLHTAITSMFKGPQDTFSYIGTGTVDGQQVAQYRDVPADKSSPTTISSFPLYGPILPIEIDAGSQGHLTLVWNKPAPITAPPADQIVTLPSS
jgi:hypothetical protein